MGKKVDSQSCCEMDMSSCFAVEAVISIDNKGQIVIPKAVRLKANISSGDKLALTSCQKEGKVCCMILTKAKDLSDAVRATLES
jgi:AbrB family looped-hinge helix DNA binding protein